MSRFSVQRRFVDFGLFYRVGFFNILASVRKYGVKVKGIWALYESTCYVGLARYDRPKFGHIQRNLVYRFMESFKLYSTA
jgi:hypothetical protein